MRKIVILGGSGAGKSTLAMKLGEILNIPAYHLDAIHWQPGWTPIEKEQFIKKQDAILEQDAWIIDGNYTGTLDKRLKQADTVIFLHYHTIHYLYRIVKRRIQYHNKSRPDMGEGCTEKIDWEFFQWVKNFNRTKAAAIYERLNQLENKSIHIFKSPKELENFLRNLVNQQSKIDS